MTQGQFDAISEWQNKTFGHATALSKMAHLEEEIVELRNELILEDNNIESAKNKKLEFADCFILLFGAAASDGMSYEDIIRAIDDKMQINYNRKWGAIQPNGVVNHIKEGDGK